MIRGLKSLEEKSGVERIGLKHVNEWNCASMYCHAQKSPPSESKDLNIRPETIKYLEVNAGTTIYGLYLNQDSNPTAKEAKPKITKWDYMNMKSFCTAMDISTQVEFYRVGESLYTTHLS